MPAISSVTVYAGSSRRAPPELLDLARALGRGIAEQGWTLVYGGAQVGLMGALADGALAAGGRVEGVLLDTFARVAHAGLHTLETVGDMRTRKASLAHRGDAYVVLPGGLGTLEEFAEILVERQLGLHARPLVLVDYCGFWQPLLAQFDAQLRSGFVTEHDRASLEVVTDARAALEHLRRAATSPDAGEAGSSGAPGDPRG